jgi:hypothetical protein
LPGASAGYSRELQAPVRGTYRGKKLINDILKGVVFRLDPEPVIPSEAVADDEAAEDVVRAEYTDDAESEEGQGDAE